jgi:hypothetical protein
MLSETERERERKREKICVFARVFVARARDTCTRNRPAVQFSFRVDKFSFFVICF